MIPVRAYLVEEEPQIIRKGKVAVNVDQLVMSLLTAGSECVEMRSMYEKNPWNKAIREMGWFHGFWNRTGNINFR